MKFTTTTQADGKIVIVTAFCNGKRVLAWSATKALAPRLVRAVEAGVAFTAHDAETITINGIPTTCPAGWSPTIMGRYMSSDLKALGF